MFQASIRLYGTNTLFWDYFSGQKRVFWALGLHNSIKSYADGTMICLLTVNVHKDMFYSNAGAFSGHYCWKSRFWSILGVKRGDSGQLIPPKCIKPYIHRRSMSPLILKSWWYIVIITFEASLANYFEKSLFWAISGGQNGLFMSRAPSK